MGTAAIEAEVLARAAVAGWPLWRFEDTAVAVGPLFAHVRHGRVVSWGVEPIGDVLVAADGAVTRFTEGARRRVRRSTAAAAGASAAVTTAAVAVAASLLRRRATAR